MRTFHPIAHGVLTASCLALACAAAPELARAGTLDELSARDATGGLRAALGQGIDQAVAHLGAPDGFLANPKVTIPLPAALEKADRALRLVGMSGDADALKVAMNRAAEAAVAEATPVLKQALQRMTIEDAKDILTGGDDSATAYFRRATTDSLTARFKPIVARETAKLKLASLYDQYAGKAAEFGLVRSEDVHLNEYVTSKALDALFSEIGDEERAIRHDPLGQANSLIRRAFGAVH